jgi:flagellin
LDETNSALQRLRELAVQSANDTNTSDDRASIQLEVDALVNEINRIASDTEFNNQNLLNASFKGKVMHVGAYSGQTITVSIDGATAASLGVSGIGISTQAKAEAAISTIDTAIQSISDSRSYLGAMQNRFESAITNMENASVNAAASLSQITDADIAAETANLTKNSIMQQAAASILAQANQQPQIAMMLLG